MKRVSREYATLTAKFATRILSEFPEGTCVSRPQGGYILWVRLPKGTDSVQLQQMALKKKISIAPGPVFSAQQTYREFIRVNCAIPWSPQVERGISTLAGLLHKT
jgi:DNA-binding transcriptional MocR family regulator